MSVSNLCAVLCFFILIFVLLLFLLWLMWIIGINVVMMCYLILALPALSFTYDIFVNFMFHS